jgi:hypothetical protein
MPQMPAKCAFGEKRLPEKSENCGCQEKLTPWQKEHPTLLCFTSKGRYGIKATGENENLYFQSRD